MGEANGAPPTEHSDPVLPPLLPDRILPALAFFRLAQSWFDSKRRVVLYISSDRFASGTLPKNREISDAGAAPGGYEKFRAQLDLGAKEVPIDEITKVEIGPKQGYGRLWKLNFQAGCLLRVTTGKKKLEWIVPSDAADVVKQAFQVVCPDRLTEAENTRPARGPSINGLLMVLLVILLPMTSWVVIRDFSAQPMTADSDFVFLFLWSNLLWATGALALALLVENLYRWRRFRRERAPQADLSGRKQVSMPGLGVMLKLVGGLLFAVIYLGSFLFPFYTLMPGWENWGPDGPLVSYAIIYLVLAFIIYAGYRLSAVPAKDRLESDPRAPILFLRAFEDDGSGSYNPHGLASYVLGLRAPTFLLNIHPIRVLRMVINRPVDTAEEQIASFLPRFGPFVAIGRPGERVPLGGAARVYVGNEEWKQTVLDFLGRSQFVILQPAETSGVWWEVSRMLEHKNCAQVLLTLVNFIGKPNRYTLFRWRFEQMTGRQLPRQQGDAVFCRFKEDWQPQLLPGRQHSPFAWPLIGCGLNFEKTLRPFLDGLKGIPSPEPLPHDSRAAFIRTLPHSFAIMFWIALFSVLGDLLGTQSYQAPNESVGQPAPAPAPMPDVSPPPTPAPAPNPPPSAPTAATVPPAADAASAPAETPPAASPASSTAPPVSAGTPPVATANPTGTAEPVAPAPTIPPEPATNGPAANSAFTDYDVGSGYHVHLSGAWTKAPQQPNTFFLSIDGQPPAIQQYLILNTAGWAPDPNRMDTLLSVEQAGIDKASGKPSTTLDSRDFTENGHVWRERRFAYVEPALATAYVTTASVTMDGDYALMSSSSAPQSIESTLADTFAQARQGLIKDAAGPAPADAAPAATPTNPGSP